jgi:hypothetical protein
MSILIISPEQLPIQELIYPLKEVGIDVKHCNTYDLREKNHYKLVINFCTKEEGLAFNQIALKENITWIPIEVSYSIARVGPIIIPNETACYNCLNLRMKSNGVEELRSFDKFFKLSFSLVCKVLAIEIVKWVTREKNPFVCNLINNILEINSFILDGTLSPVYYVPSCSECGVSSDVNSEMQFIRGKSMVEIYD